MISTASPELGPAHAPSLRDRERAEARARRNPLVWLREIIVIIVVALLISSLLRAFIIQVFWIPSPSMRNTLVEDDRIAVSRIDALDQTFTVVMSLSSTIRSGGSDLRRSRLPPRSARSESSQASSLPAASRPS